MYEVGYHPLHWEPRQPVITTNIRAQTGDSNPDRGNSVPTEETASPVEGTISQTERTVSQAERPVFQTEGTASDRGKGPKQTRVSHAI